jgi:hypothetical protein
LFLEEGDVLDKFRCTIIFFAWPELAGRQRNG